ncbi:MAG TPA: hypothetical protein DC057_16210 [Spirochaetia bacterium]|nr:hypothetical protein [Spirochaetia bacterium]
MNNCTFNISEKELKIYLNSFYKKSFLRLIFIWFISLFLIYELFHSISLSLESGFNVMNMLDITIPILLLLTLIITEKILVKIKISLIKTNLPFYLQNENEIIIDNEYFIIKSSIYEYKINYNFVSNICNIKNILKIYLYDRNCFFIPTNNLDKKVLEMLYIKLKKNIIISNDPILIDKLE